MLECGFGPNRADVVKDPTGAREADEGVGVVEEAILSCGRAARCGEDVVGETELLDLDGVRQLGEFNERIVCSYQLRRSNIPAAT